MRIRVVAVVVALAFPAASSAGTIFLLDGRGWGHGVGMSQWGAEGYARHGYGYRKILAHYYSQTQIAIAEPRRVRVLLVAGRGDGACRFCGALPRRRRARSQASSSGGGGRRRPAVPAPSQASGGPDPVRAGRSAAPARRWRLPRRSRRPAGARRASWPSTCCRSTATCAVWSPGRRRRAGTRRPTKRRRLQRGRTRSRRCTRARTSTFSPISGRSCTAAFAPSVRRRILRSVRPRVRCSSGTTRSSRRSTSPARAAERRPCTMRGRARIRFHTSPRSPTRTTTSRRIMSGRRLRSASRSVARVLRVRGVRDLRVVDNSSGRAQAVRVLTASGWKTFPAEVVRRRFALGSTDFQVRVMSLDAPSSPAIFGDRVQVHGWVRGLGKARLQALTPTGWQVIARIHPTPAGRFTVTLACPALDATPACLQHDRRRRGRPRRHAAAGCPGGRHEASCTRFTAAAVRGAAPDAAHMDVGRPRNRKLRPHPAAR